MGTQSLRERNKAKRREAVVAAAMELFATHGYHETTIPEIAERAEVAPRTVAMYFPSKLDIVKEDIDRAVRSLSDALAGAISDSPVEISANWIRESLLQDDATLRYRLRMYAKNDELAALLHGRLAEVISRALQSPGDMSSSEHATNLQIMAVAISAVLRYLALETTPETFDDVALRARRFLRGGMMALGEAGSQ